MKNNQGTAIILSLVIVSVLFILISFLVRKVLTNTTMVQKTGEEQESYTKAKQGILYALDQLNTWEGTDPDYDPTDWTPNEVEQGNWSDYSNYSLMVYKGYIPAPSGYTENEDYITIESQDLPKKLVTLQAITKKTSPLLDYVRLINSDVSFTTGQTFSDTTYGSLIHINGDLVLTGTNLLYLNTNRADRLEVAGEIRPKVSTTTVTISDPALHLSDVFLDANDNNDDGYKCGFTRDASGNLLAEEKFDTAYDNIVQNDGRYFDGAHLPSSYDQSGVSPLYVTGKALLRWPLINDTRYENLVGGSGSPYYVDEISSNDESGTWYDITASEWIDDRTGLVPSPGSTQSATYTSDTATLVILDGDGRVSGTRGQVGIDDGEGGGTAYNNVIESGEWRSYPPTPNRVIYSPGNLRVLGIIGDDLTPADYKLTIVSGGTIYIESNLAKGTSGSSLALIAKDWITLNPTHRFINESVVATAGLDLWIDQDKILGESDGIQMDVTVSKEGTEDTAVLSLGQEVCTDKITLKKINLPDTGGDLILRVYASNDSTPSIMTDDVQFGSDYTAMVTNDDITFDREEGPLTFKYIKLNLQNNSITTDHPVRFDAVEVQLTEINAVCFAQNKSWAVISGNISGYPFAVNGAISENQFEQSSNWSINWPSITYTHDPTVAPNPNLPPSVNLVSLKRK